MSSCSAMCGAFFLWCGVSVCLVFPLYKSTMNLNRCGDVWLRWMLSPGNRTHLRCELGTDESSEDFMKELATNSRTGASQSSPRLKSTKGETFNFFLSLKYISYNLHLMRNVRKKSDVSLGCYCKTWQLGCEIGWK